MKTTTKALCYSAFIFPGLGHLILKQYKTSVVLIVTALILTVIILVNVISIALQVTDMIINNQIVPNIVEMQQLVIQQLKDSKGEFLNWVTILLGLTWFIGVADVYRLSRVKH